MLRGYKSLSVGKVELSGLYIVDGPARLIPISGKLQLFGADITEPIVVPVGRSIPIVAKEAEIGISPGTNVLRKGDENIYKKAEFLAKEVSNFNPPVILIGPTDVGKSTIAFWAASLAKLKGERAQVASIDVGQNEVYLPGFEALAEVELPLVPGKVKSEKIYSCFVGSFTPSRSLSRYYSCFSLLIRVASSGWTIIDTDGWVEVWGGIESKAFLLKIANEGTPVIIGSKYIADLLKRFGLEVKFFESVAEGRKSRDERRRNRIRLISSILARSSQKAIKANKVDLIGFPIFNCEEDRELMSSSTRILHAERCEDGREVVVIRGRPEGMLRAKLLKDGWERGLLIGLSEGELKDRPGLLVKINYRSKMLNVIIEENVSPLKVFAGFERLEEVLSTIKV